VLGRSRNRDRGRGAGVGGINLLNSATIYLGGVAPFHWLDFIANRALYAGADVGNVTGATGYSFTRASDGYYQNSDGTLTLFGSGALRRGDRGVLIEGSRTNLVLQSQTLDNASWSKTAGAVTANATVAPDGTTTADEFISSGAAGSYIRQNITVSAATAYTFSVYLKASVNSWVLVEVWNSGVTKWSGRYVNLATGALGTATSGGGGLAGTVSTQALGNGWFRVIVSLTSDNTTLTPVVYVADADLDTTVSNLASIYIWQADLQAGAFPSSPIVTVAAAATRAADVLTYTAGVSYGLSLWAEFERVVDTGAVGAVFQIDAGSNNDAARIEHNSSTPALARGLVVTGGVQQALVSALTITLNQVTKMAQRVQTDSVNFARNTTLGNEDTSSTLPATPTTMRVGQTATGAWPFGYIRRAAVFTTALTDAQLQTVTT